MIMENEKRGKMQRKLRLELKKKKTSIDLAIL